MLFKVLLLTPDEPAAREEIHQLTQQGLHIVWAPDFSCACRHLRDDPAIHVILTEWEAPVDDPSGRPTIQGAEMFNEFLRLRYEVNIFLFTSERVPGNITAGGILNGYFYKADRDWEDIARKIQAEVANSKNRAPFYETLVQYASLAKDSWHTPGHSSGYSVRNSPWVKDYYEFFGRNLFAADVSVSVPMLDSLLHPTGVIREAQELAARAFSSRYTFFSTNGTSTSNKVLLQTLLKPGDAVLLDRNCHKSVHYGILISGAAPVYLMPSVNTRYGLFGPVPKARILDRMDRAMAAGLRVKVLILTNCTYDGLTYDIADIVREAHRRGVKVIVDEAWFGHARFHPEFYPCAMQAGADYATQSTHKTMSAFSQGSMIHVNDPDFESFQDFFMENFNMHTSTSPQYPMIASLDAARKQMVMEGYGLLCRSLELSDSLRRSINSLRRFRVLDLPDLLPPDLAEDAIRLDRTKLTIDVSASGVSSREVEHLLMAKHNIQIEKSTFNTITVLITIGSTFSKLNRLYMALENIERMSGNISPAAQPDGDGFRLSLSPMRYRPRQAFYRDGERVPLRKAVGRVSSVMVVPYPPGIPLLVPGQIVSAEIVEALQTYLDHGVEVHGIRENMLQVLTAADESFLTERGYTMTDIGGE